MRRFPVKIREKLCVFCYNEKYGTQFKKNDFCYCPRGGACGRCGCYSRLPEKVRLPVRIRAFFKK